MRELRGEELDLRSNPGISALRLTINRSRSPLQLRAGDEIRTADDAVFGCAFAGNGGGAGSKPGQMSPRVYVREERDDSVPELLETEEKSLSSAEE
jgi:hypothetical protein